MNTTRPGWQTTEFWLTAVFVAWWNRKYPSHNVDAIAVQGAVSGAAIGVYALVRMFTKRAAAHPLAYAPVPPIDPAVDVPFVARVGGPVTDESSTLSAPPPVNHPDSPYATKATGVRKR